MLGSQDVGRSRCGAVKMLCGQDVRADIVCSK